MREAQLTEFIKSLPEGLDTKVGERGVRLSGGQRQRIGIARALYGNPEFLVLDEATSALDSDTEKAVMEAIDSLHGRKTMLIIAHRLTTIRNCDLIFEVSDGKVIPVDRADFDEMLKEHDTVSARTLGGYGISPERMKSDNEMTLSKEKVYDE